MPIITGMDGKTRKDLAKAAKEWRDQARALRERYPAGNPQREVAVTLDGCAQDIEHALEKADQREKTKVLRGNGTNHRRVDDSYEDDEDEEYSWSG